MPALRRAVLLVPLLLGATAPVAAPAAGDEPFAVAAREVQKALGEKDPGPLADALFRLKEFDGEPAARLLLSTAFRRDVPDFVLDAACDALGAFRSREAAEPFVRDLEKTRDPRRFALLEALGRLKHAGAEEALVAAAEDRDPRFRAAAVRALADRRAPTAAARGAAERACLDPDPRVRSAGIAALAEWRGLPGALPLLGRLSVEKGRLYGDAWRGLRRISGRDLPPVPDAWARWWSTQPGEEEWRFESSPQPPAPSVRGPGIHSFTRRVVFVLDTSDGMADKPGYAGADLAPDDCRKDPAVFAEWKAIQTRLDHARCHVARLVRGLPADASFDVVFGAESANAVFRGCQPATPENRERALGRLKGLNAHLRQDVLRLAQAAWAGSPEGDPLSPEAFTEGADTVVYFGTALPSFGAERDPGRVASTVRRWNRVRQVQFFGVGVGSHGSGLLADLAGMLPIGETATIQ
jgi:hypothetical protein